MTIEGKATKVAKKIFGPMHQRGAHISLWKGGQRGPLKAIRPGTAVEVSEGIEDGLSYAMANPLARVLAAGTLGIIGELRMPVQAGDFILLGQNDTKPQPLASREDAIKAQQAQARAQGSDRQVRLKLPPQGVKDWNDWLRSEVG